MFLSVNDQVLPVEWARNSSVDALRALLAEGPLTLSMKDYANMEIFGRLGATLPRNDALFTTEAGDVILFEGQMLAIYYAPNTWRFTRLGRLKDVDARALKKTFKCSHVTVTLALEEGESAL